MGSAYLLHRYPSPACAGSSAFGSSFTHMEPKAARETFFALAPRQAWATHCHEQPVPTVW